MKPDGNVVEFVTPATAFAPTRDVRARNHLRDARRFYDRVVEQYAAAPPTDDLGRLYERLAHFYRADCAFDLGDFDAAIALYEAAGARYQDDPATLSASVQIVNAHLAAGRPDEAKRANERARWLLGRIPAEAFGDGRVTLSRDRWQGWLQWAGEAW